MHARELLRRFCLVLLCDATTTHLKVPARTGVRRSSVCDTNVERCHFTVSPGHMQDNQATEVASQPRAIQRAYPHLKAGLSFLLASSLALYRLLVALAFNISKPILLLSPVPIALYILSPIFTLCSVLFDMLVLMPFKAAVYLFDALYPLYVFCGVACIMGCLLGLGGRYLSDVLVKMAAESVSRGSPGGEEELSSSSTSSPNPDLYDNSSYSAMESEKESEE